MLNKQSHSEFDEESSTIDRMTFLCCARVNMRMNLLPSVSGLYHLIPIASYGSPTEWLKVELDDV
jgi:hypothetical protein